MSDAPAESPDVDPTELRDDLDQIKSAMGIEERYPGQARLWFVYAVVVAGLSISLQLLFFYPLPNWAYIATWMVFFAVIVGTVLTLARRTGRDGAGATPDFWVIVAALGLLLFALTSVSQPIGTAADVESVVIGAYFFAMAIAVAGAGFILVGNALKTHRIRRRDRWVFYAGGVWMLAFASLFPNVEILRYLGYGVFGVLTVVHALVSYYVLTRD